MYIGRFAPSPTGPLHEGSLVTALASWLDARAHHGRWIVRIEDVDTTRCIPGADRTILQQLAACGLRSDQPPVWQSRRSAFYQAALDRLVASRLAYPCTCSRSDVRQHHARAGHESERGHALPYPGICRPEHGGARGTGSRAWRLHVPRAFAATDGQREHTRPPGPTVPCHVDWHDRRLGPRHEDVLRCVGDFVLKRSDGLWAYQLAVVVDDHLQGITHVVRGADLAGNTARQILLQRALGLPPPSYLHVPLVLASNSEKLSKQNGAQPVDLSDPAAALARAACHLGLPAPTAPHKAPDLLQRLVPRWQVR